MKKTALPLAFLLVPFFLSAQLQLVGHLPYQPLSLAGCWHYVDSSGGEWALVGTSGGLSIVDVNNPAQPVERFAVPGLPNNWRELKTWAGFAYVGSEAAGSGITIVDLRHLPDTVYYKTWLGDGPYQDMVQRSHTVAATDGWLYIFGGGNVTNGATIADLSDPWNPVIAGAYTDRYIHDGFIRNDTLWASEIYDGQFTVVDVSDKSNPQALTSIPTPAAFNHNTGLSDDSRYLFSTDEKSDAPLGSFDVSDLNNVTLLDRYFPSQSPSHEVHNVRVIGNFLVNPSYGGQLTIVDATRPDNLIETAWTSLGSSLVWDADPYLPSGIIFATAKNEGLFIYQPTYKNACWLEGQVTDALSGLPVNGAKVFILNTLDADTTRPSGEYKTGHGTAGTYSVLAEKPGYLPKTIPGVTLQNGQVTLLDIALTPESVATTDPQAEPGWQVFPTVFRDALTVVIPAGSPLLDGRKAIQVVDVDGKTVSEQFVSGEKTQLLLGDQPAGAYWIRVQGDVAVKPVQKLRGR